MLKLTAILIVTTLLSACSGGGSDQTESSSITLSRVQTVAGKATVIPAQDSILDLDVQWQTWDGQEQQSIRVTDDAVTIIGDPNASDVVIGAHDYRISLIAGAEYVLDVDDLSTDGAAALIFPYLGGGKKVSVTSDDYAIATPGNPFRFTAPVGIKGFWIQVQNKWGDAATDATIRPVLGTVTTLPIATSGELIDLSVPFQHWQVHQNWFDFNDPFDCVQPADSATACRSPGITTDGDEIVIAPAERFNGNVISYIERKGVQFYPGVPLSGTYELTVTSETPFVGVYLVGLNQLGFPDLRNTALAITGNGFSTNKSLLTANNVPGFAIQIQSPWVISNFVQAPGARLQISLKRLDSDIPGN